MKNLSEISSAIAKEHGMTNAKALSVVRSVFRHMTNGLIGITPDSRDRVSIAEFGNFAVKKTSARQVKSLKTGEMVDVPANVRITFKATDSLRKSVLEGKPLEAAPAEAAQVAETAAKEQAEVDITEIPDLNI